MVREHVFPSGVCPDALTRPSSLSIETIPKAIHLILHESFMASISEVFSRASHEGPVDVALEAGVTLLALYVLIYPLNYPQIGKLAKYSDDLCFDPDYPHSKRNAFVGNGENSVERCCCGKHR